MNLDEAWPAEARVDAMVNALVDQACHAPPFETLTAKLAERVLDQLAAAQAADPVLYQRFQLRAAMALVKERLNKRR